MVMLSKVLKISLGLMVTILIYSFVIPLFSPYSNPMAWNLVPKDQPPSLNYLFGTTSLGQDVFWLTSFALRNSIIFATLTGVIAISIALLIGTLAGAAPGIISTILSFVMDSFCVLPALPIIILMGTLWRGRMTAIILALFLSIFGWAWPARIIRSVVLSIREREFVYIARISGYRLWEIIFNIYLPYIYGLVLINFLGVSLWAIGMETTLAVFGLTTLGLPTIGTTIFWAMNYLAIPRGIWWWIFFPILFLMMFIVLVYTISREIYIEILGKAG